MSMMSGFSNLCRTEGTKKLRTERKKNKYEKEIHKEANHRSDRILAEAAQDNERELQ